MSKSKHTPGDWDFACDSYGKVRHSRKACVYTRAMTPTGEVFIHIASRIPSWEDARLIAAAPGLLAVLEKIIASKDVAMPIELDEEIRAAISKALSPEVFTPASVARIAERDDLNDIAALLLG